MGQLNYIYGCWSDMGIFGGRDEPQIKWKAGYVGERENKFE